MFGIQLAKIIEYVVIAAVAGYTTYDKLHDRHIRKNMKLKPNPKQCKEHTDGLSAIQSRLSSIDTEISNIKEDIKWLRDRK